MKRSIFIAAAFAVVMVSCDQFENDLAATTDTQVIEFKADGTSYFNTESLETVFTSSANDLSQEEIDGLLLMREEEKMAQEVYLKFHELWGSKVFQNISNSEATHTNAVLSLLNYFGIPDPASTEIGVFTNEAVQNLYIELITAGSESVLKAFETGAFIEEYDILDLENLLESNTNANIQLVYGNLLKGSRNHLRAFVRQINALGASYAPFLLSEENYMEIVESTMENGNSNSQIGIGNKGNNCHQGQSGMSYNDCVNNGNGGLITGTETANCDSTGVINSAIQNQGKNGKYGNRKRG